MAEPTILTLDEVAMVIASLDHMIKDTNQGGLPDREWQARMV
jgi:hypothetical protein